ncbi:MAG TPA: hypothetical protein EYP41_16230 [Anaerolineae bacterium]|nr:hypothetical protein [Anaerolineae bacterium]HIP71791.1 hypothetical protein [Anaerolineae bacterium]
MSLLRSSGSWPLLEVIINAEWEDTMQITQLVIARRGPTGQVAIGTFLIDLACLGVKNAYGYLFPNERAYRNSLRADMTSKQKMVAIELDCAAKIIEEAIAYAKKLGFRPHKDIRYARPVMGETHPEQCDLDVPLGGPEGKPFFIAGPYDNPERIMRILDRKVGPGNYTYLTPIGPETLFFEDDDFEEKWEE